MKLQPFVRTYVKLTQVHRRYLFQKADKVGLLVAKFGGLLWATYAYNQYVLFLEIIRSLPSSKPWVQTPSNNIQLFIANSPAFPIVIMDIYPYS